AADQVRPGGAPDLLTQGGSTAEPTGRTSASASAQASRGAERSAVPTKRDSASPSRTPAASPSKQTRTTPDRTKTPERTKAPAAESGKATSPAPTTTTTRTPVTKSAPAPESPSAAPTRKTSSPTPAADVSAQAAVLALVNQERSKVGCSPVTASDSLTALAQAFSEDMAARDFFGHTDPDGATPWDRAAKAGIQGLGGENIARGQADAQAVMDAWMNSEGHRANILNCDYKTLGIGVHFAPGGPWWTQDFGF
ncbi:MAG TPA: CAP domain-containing protein, partial [Streptomyces sp.]